MRTLLFLALGIQSLNSLPLSPIVQNGEVSFLENQKSLTISTSHQSIIEWSDFSIQKEEWVHFKQPSVDSLVLNRVMGPNASQIFGSLSADGHVMLINPNGILIGKDAQIDMGAFTASTVDIHGSVFDQTHEWKNDLKGKIDVMGEIIAKKIFLRADIIELHDHSHLNASLDYGKGEIELFGNTVIVQPMATVEANALIEGDGGKITYWGEEKTHYFGTTFAKGAPNGKGGFVEVSGTFLDFSGDVVLPGGMLLLDPSDVIIQAGGIATVCGVNNPPISTTFDNATLGGLLAGCSVTIQTSAGVGGLGDITVIDPITWAAGTNTLTLIADRNIFIYNNISVTSAGFSPIILTALSGNITVDALTPGIPVAVESINGSITLNAPQGNISVIGGSNASDVAAVGQTAVMPTDGDINVTAGNDLMLQGGSGSLAWAYIGRVGVPFVSFGGITGNITICVGNDMTIFAGDGLRADAYVGLGYTAGTNTGGSAACNFDIQVGRNLELMSGAIDGSSFIGTGDAVGINGDYNINVGENLYLHNHPTNDSRFTTTLGAFIGRYAYSLVVPLTFNAENMFLNVGRNLTLDSRNVTDTGGQVFISVAHSTAGIQQIHVGGDINCIAGYSDAVIRSIQSGPATNEVFVGGSIRCYNGTRFSLGAYDASAMVISGIRPFPGVDPGLVTIRAGSNIIQGGGGNFSGPLTSSQSVFIEADSTFAAGELWTPQSCIINGANIFTGTPLAVNSGNVSTTTPFGVGGDGLGGFAIDTTLYNCSIVAFPSSVTGYIPILSLTQTATATCAGFPIFPGFSTGSGYTVVGGDLTVNSRDRYLDSTPCDFTIGAFPFNSDEFQAFAFDGNVTIQGFRNINITRGAATVFSGDILIIAQNDIAIGPDAFGGSALFSAGNITLVTDNQAPNPPLIGGVWNPLGGSISVDGAAEIISGGFLRIYTARQSLNTWGLGASLNGLIFGVDWTLGTLFVDTNQEVWCTYYPTAINGIPFTIFYKPCLELVFEEATVVIDELLVDLHPYNEFPGWMSRYFLEFAPNLGEFRLANEPYMIRRRHLTLFNQPKTYTTFLNDDMSHPPQGQN